MPLQQLVEYFNNRFGQEHHSSFRPLILEEKKVSGLFGSIRIDSVFAPFRQTLKPTVIIGHTAQMAVATYKPQRLYSHEIDALLVNNPVQATDFESIINFDRLCRTVHMLNYLPLSHLHGELFLEVDPRHILCVKQDHGAYFQEVIVQCGLDIKNIVMVLPVNSHYARYYQQLISGLDNYRHRGYQIALKFDDFTEEDQAIDLIAKLSPDYVSFSARNLEKLHENSIVEKLQQMKIAVAQAGGQSILQQIDEKKLDLLARTTGFDLVEGGYYRAIAFDYLSNKKFECT